VVDKRVYVRMRVCVAHDFGRQPATVPTDARVDGVLFGSGGLTVLKWQVSRSLGQSAA